jgi:hypothetical protein
VTEVSPDEWMSGVWAARHRQHLHPTSTDPCITGRAGTQRSKVDKPRSDGHMAYNMSFDPKPAKHILECKVLGVCMNFDYIHLFFAAKGTCIVKIWYMFLTLILLIYAIIWILVGQYSYI